MKAAASIALLLSVGAAAATAKDPAPTNGGVRAGGSAATDLADLARDGIQEKRRRRRVAENVGASPTPADAADGAKRSRKGIRHLDEKGMMKREKQMKKMTNEERNQKRSLVLSRMMERDEKVATAEETPGEAKAGNEPSAGDAGLKNEQRELTVEVGDVAPVESLVEGAQGAIADASGEANEEEDRKLKKSKASGSKTGWGGGGSWYDDDDRWGRDDDDRWGKDDDYDDGMLFLEF